MSTPCFFILRQCPRPLLQFLSTANSIILPDAYESSYEKAKNCIWSIERHHYQWPWVALNTEPTFVRSSYGPPGNTGLLCLCYTLPLQGSAVTFFRRRGQMHNHLCHISSGWLIDWVGFNVPLTHYRSYRGRVLFLRVKLTNSVKALKEVVVIRIGFNPTRSTSPCYNTTHTYSHAENTYIHTQKWI